MDRNIGLYLKKVRQEQKLTLDKVSSGVGVSMNYISELEKGYKKNPSDDVIVNLAKTLNIDENNLFTRYGKIPLSTRRVLINYPYLAEVLSKINVNKEISPEAEKEFGSRILELYKEVVNSSISE